MIADAVEGPYTNPRICVPEDRLLPLTVWCDIVACAYAEIDDSEARAKRFLRQWTAKEAHVKATARGLYAGRTKDFSIGVRPYQYGR